MKNFLDIDKKLITDYILNKVITTEKIRDVYDDFTVIIKVIEKASFINRRLFFGINYKNKFKINYYFKDSLFSLKKDEDDIFDKCFINSNIQSLISKKDLIKDKKEIEDIIESTLRKKL